MKNTIIPIAAIVLILLIGGLNYFFKRNAEITPSPMIEQVNDVSPTPPPRFNFNYFQGETPWLNQSSAQTVIVQFRDYRIPTNSINEATQYLPIWERLFKKMNNIDNAYFNAHIFPVEARVDETRVGADVTRRLYIGYYFKVDWARTTNALINHLLISRNGVPLGEAEITADALLPQYENITVNGQQMRVWSDKKKGFVYINNIQPIRHVASQEDIIDGVEEISRRYNLNFSFDVNDRISTREDGNLSGWIDAVLDQKKYRCLRGDILLEDATVSNVAEYYCGPIY